jgi:hypothetical protein
VEIPEKPPGRRLNWWQSLLAGVAALVPLLWYVGPLAVRFVAAKLRLRRVPGEVMNLVRDRAKPGLTIDVRAEPGGFVELSGRDARLRFELAIGDTGLMPAPEVVYLFGVTAARGPMAGRPGQSTTGQSLVSLLGDEPPAAGYERIQHRSSEELNVAWDSVASGDRWLHVCCASRVTVTRDVRYVERVYRFNVGRDGARAVPVPDTSYSGWVEGSSVRFD